MSFANNEIIILENSLKYLRRHLAWPPKNMESNSKYYPIFYAKYFWLWLTTSIVWVGEIVYLILSILDRNYYTIDLDLAILISLTGTFYFNFQYLKNVENTAQVYIALSDLKTFGKPYNFDEQKKKLNKYAQYHYIYIIIALITYGLAPMMEFTTCKSNNIKYGQTITCGLISNIWTPFNQRIFPRTQLLYALQVYSAFYSFVTSSIISFSILESVEHLIVRFQHVGCLFVEALNEKKYILKKIKLGNCIRYHNVILKIVEKFDKSVNGCMFLHVLLTGAILGFVAYRLMRSASLTAVALLFGWFLSLVMVCTVGQRLMHASSSIADVICASNWYGLETDIQKDLILPILRCKKPTYLHAGPFGYMSFAMIITILKTSYSYFTLMNQTA